MTRAPAGPAPGPPPSAGTREHAMEPAETRPVMQSVAIGMIVGQDRVPVETLQSLLSLTDRRLPHVRLAGRCIQPSGPDVAAGRNLVVEAFLTMTTGDWLLFIDADMVFTPDDVDRLVTSADPEHRPLISGLYFRVTTYEELTPSTYTFEPERGWQPIINYQRNTIVPCDTFGAGFLLCHRSVFTRMRDKHSPLAPWFDWSWSEDGNYRFAEDFTFCLRAKALGIQPYVNTAVTVGHLKPIVVNEQTYLRAPQIAVQYPELASLAKQIRATAEQQAR